MRKSINQKNYISFGYQAMENKRFVIGENLEGEKVKIDAEALQWRISVYGILVRDSKLLLAQSIYSEKLFLPGGAMEQQEELESALEREFQEETGLLIRPKELISVKEDFFKAPRGDSFHALKFYYFVQLVRGELMNNDPKIKSLIWVDKQDLKSVNLSPQIEFIRDLLK